MKNEISKTQKVIYYLLLSLIVLSIAATYYRYVVLEDFAIETKPIEEFTEDDL